MKCILGLTVVLSLLLCCGCVSGLPEEQLSEKDPQVIVASDPKDPPAPAEPEEMSATPDEDAAALPYLEKVTKDCVEIMSGPGYGTEFVMIIEPGTYTIVEESSDENGLLWGKLKSGAGWIDLTYNREITNVFGPITVDFAKGEPSPGSFVFRQEESPSQSLFTIRTAEKVTALSLCTTSFLDSGFVPADTLYTLDALTPEQELFAGLNFYGDLTSYAVTFTGSDGAVKQFTIVLSGRDGSIILNEYKEA